MNETATPALALSGVSKVFVRGKRTVRALADVTIRVPAGGVTGLIGPDGAGKTTLMRLATVLMLADTGRIEVLGIDARAEPLAVQSSVGYMPQRFGLYEDLTVQENLDLYADLQAVPHSERPQRYAELRHMTGLGAFTGRLVGHLSGGMKQKLGLACTLVRSPRVLLLDEPTVGVDPVSRRELWAIVYRLVREHDVSVLLSTAYLDEAQRCDEVILLHEGRILGQQPPAAFSRPLQGRVFRISAGLNKRRLQRRLGDAPVVLDALIEGETIRVIVTAGTSREQLAACVAGLPALRLDAVSPSFEDAFIAMLQTRDPGATPLPGAPLAAGGPADEVVIAVHDLTRRFGDFYAVKGISFSARRGEIFGLLGANGAGKSTTFRMLCGLLPASGGNLQVAGVDLRRAAARARARIGYMAQRFSLYGHLSVLENLNFFASAYGLAGSERHARIGWALRDFGLEDVKDAASADLPLGYKQRLALAAALMHRPEILFLDEPTSGVDPLARREFWRHINALAESGVTVLVTTHFMDEANYCDRLVIMADGEILAAGTPEAMKAHLRTPERPDPTMEDTFIGLIEKHQSAAPAT